MKGIIDEKSFAHYRNGWSYLDDFYAGNSFGAN